MFRLLSKESNIFSIPVYMAFLMIILVVFNILNVSELSTITTVITFIGIALGYFVFNQIKLNYQSHLPLFLYTIFIFSFYPGDLDIGIAITLLTNSFILLFLSSTDDDIRKDSYLLIGALVIINFIFLPTTWPIFYFVILHIFGTSKRAALDLFKYLFGGLLIGLSYFSVAYFLNFNSWDVNYFPFTKFSVTKEFYPLYLLLPIVILFILALMNHFKKFNEQSPSSRFKYGFILIFTLAQIITIFMYMGKTHQYLLLLALPISIILGRYLKFIPKQWMREGSIWLIIICAVLFKIGAFFKLF